MRSLRALHILWLFPLMALLAALPGCGEEVKGKKRPYTGDEDEGAARLALEPKSYGTITGKVTYDGDPPPRDPIKMGQNEASCHSGAPADENLEQQWIVAGPNGGIKNVVIMLQPGAGKFFPVPEDQVAAAKDVLITQPHCQFRPRVFTFFPQRWDGKTGAYVATGKKVMVENNAGFDHNFSNFMGDGPGAGTLRPGKISDPPLMVDPQDRPYGWKCDIHAWMRCYGFALDHPYAAVTGDDGSFKIENAPLDVELQVVCWHEPLGFPAAYGGQKGNKRTLKAGDGLEFKLKAK